MSAASKIEELAEWLAAAQSIVAFTGAGISTPSGIPDFRSPDSGLWNDVEPMQVASIYGFRQNPRAFYDWVRPLTQLTMDAQPNPAHEALHILEQHHGLHTIITQNIDMLHTKAGNQTIYELHGHMRDATCINCFEIYPAEPILEQFMEDDIMPRCEKCGGILKPNVILFGEQLPIQVLQAAQKAAKACDLMLIIGSSLEVAPASEIPLVAKRRGAKLALINLSPTSYDSHMDLIIQGDAAEILPSVVKCLETTSS